MTIEPMKRSRTEWKLPTFLAFYDTGSTSPTEIARAARGLVRPVFVFGESAHAFHMGKVVHSLGLETVTQRELSGRRWLEDAAVQGVLSFSDHTLEQAAEFAARAGVHCVAPEAVSALINKVHQRSRLSCTQQPVQSLPLGSLDSVSGVVRCVGLPAVIKPDVGAGSSLVSVATSEAEVRAGAMRIWASGHTPLLEELLEGDHDRLPCGDYVSVETLSVAGTHRPFAISQKSPLVRPFRETSHIWAPERGIDSVAVEQICMEALSALGYSYGLSHTEIKLTPTGSRVIEVNARVGGFINDFAQAVAGVDLIREYILSLLDDTGQRVQRQTFSDYNIAFRTICPVVEGEFVSVTGHSAARRVPGVRRVRPVMSSGTPVVGDGSSQELDLLIVSADSQEGLFTALTDALSQLDYHFVLRTGTMLKYSALELPSRDALPAGLLTRRGTA